MTKNLHEALPLPWSSRLQSKAESWLAHGHVNPMTQPQTDSCLAHITGFLWKSARARCGRFTKFYPNKTLLSYLKRIDVRVVKRVTVETWHLDKGLSESEILLNRAVLQRLQTLAQLCLLPQLLGAAHAHQAEECVTTIRITSIYLFIYFKKNFKFIYLFYLISLWGDLNDPRERSRYNSGVFY